MAYDLDSTRVCIAVFDTAKDAEKYRLALLNNGVPFAWADDNKSDLVNGYCLYVQECDARGAYVRLKAIRAKEQ